MASTSDELFTAIEAGNGWRRNDPGCGSVRRGRSRRKWGLGADAGALPLRPRPGADRQGPGGSPRRVRGGGARRRGPPRSVLDEEPSRATAYSGDGFTALHFAAFFGHPDAVSLLIDRGAEVDAFGRGWMTGTACIPGRVVSSRRSSASSSKPERTPTCGSRGWTPLHAAAMNGDLVSVELLLAAGADAAATNDEGRTVADLAAESGDAVTIERVRSALQPLAVAGEGVLLLHRVTRVPTPVRDPSFRDVRDAPEDGLGRGMPPLGMPAHLVRLVLVIGEDLPEHLRRHGSRRSVREEVPCSAEPDVGADRVVRVAFVGLHALAHVVIGVREVVTIVEVG